MTLNVHFDHAASVQSDEEALSDGGVAVSLPSITGSQEYYEDGEWAHVIYPDEIYPEDSASRPHTPKHEAPSAFGPQRDFALPSALIERSTRSTNPYFLPPEGPVPAYNLYPQPTYPYPQPTYPYPVQPYYLAQQPNILLPNPLVRFRNPNLSMTFSHYFTNLRNIRGKALKPDNDETKSNFSKNFPSLAQTLSREDLKIHQTRCVSGLENGDHDIVVLTTESRSVTKDLRESTYDSRWMHIESDAMDLETFESEALHCPGVHIDETSLILALFKHLRDNNEKKFVHGRFLEPTFVTFTGTDPELEYSDRLEQKSATFICFPYLSLETLRSYKSTEASPIHVVRSLLQCHYGLESTESRDRDQVVCKLDMGPHAIHVPQLWCLLLNNDKIITTAPATFSALCSDYIKVEEVTTPTRAAAKLDTIEFFDLIGNGHFLPIEKCNTWTDTLVVVKEKGLLPCNILDDSWMDIYEIVSEGQIVTDRLWSTLLRDQSSAVISLMLTRKCLAPPGSSSDDPLSLRSNAERDEDQISIATTGTSDASRQQRTGSIGSENQANNTTAPQKDEPEQNACGTAKVGDAESPHIFTTTEMPREVHAQQNENGLKISPIFTWRTSSGDVSEQGIRRERPSSERTRTRRSSSRMSFTGSTTESYRYESYHKTSSSPLHNLLNDADEQVEALLSNHHKERNYFESILAREKKDVETIIMNADTSNSQSDSIWAKKKFIVTQAMQVLNGFLPPDEQSRLVQSFYGAMWEILSEDLSTESKSCGFTNANPPQQVSHSSLDHLSFATSQYKAIIERIQVSAAEALEQQDSAVPVPKALISAFQHLVLYYCISCRLSKTTDTHSTPLQQLWWERCQKLLRKGRNQLVLMIHTGDYREASLSKQMDCDGIATMLIHRLVKKNSGAKSFDIIDSYSRYLSKLELQVRKAPNAAVFDNIQNLSEELNVIEDVVGQQTALLNSIQMACAAGSVPHDSFMLQCISQSGQHLRLMQECLMELSRSAEKKTVLLQSMIDVRKESNNKAILVFTTVTVIFLPLSFVSSYLGMNTVDIRGGSLHQTTFWLVSIPVTACLLFLLWAVIWMRKRTRRWYGRGMGRLFAS